MSFNLSKEQVLNVLDLIEHIRKTKLDDSMSDKETLSYNRALQDVEDALLSHIGK